MPELYQKPASSRAKRRVPVELRDAVFAEQCAYLFDGFEAWREKYNERVRVGLARVLFEHVCTQAGYSPDEIKQFKAAAEQKRQQQLEQFSTAFDRGQAPVGGS